MAWADGKPLRHDALLTEFALRAFNTGTDQFIAEQVFPSVSVDEQSDRYPIINQDGFFREYDTLRAPRGRARLVSFDVSSDSYFAENHALAADYPLEDLANAARAFQVRENHTTLITEGLRRGQEIRIANIITSGSNSGGWTSLDGSQKWSVVNSADILGQVSSAHETIRMATGFTPNTVVIDHNTLVLAQRNVRLLELFKYTRSGELPVEIIKDQIFKVDRLLVGKGIKNTSPPGVAKVNVNIWGNVVWFGYTRPTITGLQAATFGARMQWKPAGFPAPMAVQRDQFSKAGEPKVEVVECMYWQDEKVLAKDLGYAITNTV